MKLARKGISCSFQFILSFYKCLTEHLLSDRPCPRSCDTALNQGLQIPGFPKLTVHGGLCIVPSKEKTTERMATARHAVKTENPSDVRGSDGERGSFRWGGLGKAPSDGDR